VFSAKGAASCEAGVSPHESWSATAAALKARLGPSGSTGSFPLVAGRFPFSASCRKSEPDWQLQAGSLCSPELSRSQSAVIISTAPQWIVGSGGTIHATYIFSLCFELPFVRLSGPIEVLNNSVIQTSTPISRMQAISYCSLNDYDDSV